ncbi:MAG: DNA gyrase subunit A [Victivallaceae bacterium]|nr:DNA gyrase subunit A [Victivallaceae bacterium]MDD3116592.1 DNA gyrase subunit A [Victivallaceae bacterium]MDD4317609.1 DNA gyrase subunit A [Victivallaceae bacterium]MDD5662979.1 DNA gyrase subunit A [Victivallaceae bacterium]NLK84137.1 DNA gyrase subunit A [Lentisphaerota bacterium]
MTESERKDFPISIEDIMHTAYLQYSLSVNVGRAIPDVRDGLKPVTRRILFAMRQMGLTKSHAYTKSAKVVGEVIGKYHPHGDGSVYDAMVRLAQDFAMRSPLVDGQGNFGSIDGDPAAAYRYTECRLERLAEELLRDIEKDTVDMMPTFDESANEPSVLPAMFPHLLVNGNTGIGVGMATNIPPHRLGEVINATICLLENPTASIDELMEFLPGPDFPTGAIIRGKKEIRRLYQTGKGSIRIRSRANIIEKDGREQIIITEIPYAVNKENMVKRIADLVKDKRITDISNIRDESSRRVGIKIVIDVKRGAMGTVVLNQLYAIGGLETSFGATMLVVDHNRPRIMNLSQILQAFIDHRMEVVIRRANYELRKAEARAHILEGLLVAVASIDDVVKIIRESRTKEEAANQLMARFQLTKIQVDAILEMRLHQLTGLAIEDLQKEYEEVKEFIAYLNELLSSREKRIELIKSELEEIRDKYDNKRRSEITFDDTDLDIADLIPQHDCVITVSNTGYIKRMSADDFETQHRGGKGNRGMETKDGDFVEHLFFANSHDLIFFFTDKGVMHWLKVFEIPEGSKISKGKAIVNMIKIEPGERIRAMLTLNENELDNPNRYIIMATRNGYIKKTALPAFKNLRRAGLRSIIIEENDDLIDVFICAAGDEVILCTAKGMACRFDQKDVRSMGRVTRGVTGIRFKIEGDYVVSMVVAASMNPDVAADLVSEIEVDTDEPVDLEIADDELEPDADTELENEIYGGPEMLVISNGGIGKRSYVSAYRKTRRGAKGVLNIKLREGELVIAALLVESGEKAMLITERGQVVKIPIDEVRRVGRNSVGVTVMKMKYKNDRITSAIKIKEDDEEDTVAENDNIAAQENSVDNIALTNEVDVTSGEVAETDITPENVE